MIARTRIPPIAIALLLTALSGSTPTSALASGRVDLLFGLMMPYSTDLTYAPHDVRPGIGFEAAIEPAGSPIGMTAYLGGSADWYKGETAEPPFGDWTSTDNRLLVGEIGGGIERSWELGHARLSLGGGLMASTTADRAKLGDWSRTRTTRANGEWLSVAVSKAVGRRYSFGARARYAWAEYVPDELKWVKAGGLQLGLTLGLKWPEGR